MPATGGVPRRLTDGAYDDDNPVWFPSGRRIAFRSSRVHALMSAEFDPATGRIAGPLKRVSLDETGAWGFDVSPDGARIVYADRNRLRVIPASGGTATTILDRSAPGSGMLMTPRFSADGRQVFVSELEPANAHSRLLRVPASGGAPAIVMVGPQDGMAWRVAAAPAHDRVIVYGPRTTSILTLSGDTIAVIPQAWPGSSVAFSNDGRRLYRVATSASQVVRLVPTNGGTPIDATPGNCCDYPIAWSSDGKRLYSILGDTNALRSKAGVMVTEVQSGARRFAPFEPLDAAVTWNRWRTRAVSDDGRFWALEPRTTTPASPSSSSSFLLYDTQTRRSRELPGAALLRSWNGASPGGPAFYFTAEKGAQMELRTVRGDGEPRVLLTSARLRAARVAVRRDRIALGEIRGDSTVFYLARPGSEERLLATIAGHVSQIVWSPDGSRLAGTIKSPPSVATPESNVLFLGVSEQGTLVGAPRFVRTDRSWDLAWLADGRAVTVLENQAQSERTCVLRVPVDPGQQPTSLTPNERGTFWDQYTSPDGRYVAIPVERSGPSTLWSIDIDAAAKAWRANKGNAPSQPGTQ
jgi:Tol biopolymer transport system component